MKHALVTGANRGIGLELCRQLSDKGYEVHAACRHTSKELSEITDHVIEGIDVGKDECVEQLRSKLGNEKFDLVINCAGILKSTALDNLDFSAMEQQFAVNSAGPLRVVKAVLGRIAGGGKIIMITSRMGSIGDNSGGGAYGYRMSKAALNAASVSLAIDLKPKNIAVGIIHPGYVKTDMTGHSGHIESPESARGVIARIEELNLDNSGTFWHQNGEILPW